MKTQIYFLTIQSHSYVQLALSSGNMGTHITWMLLLMLIGASCKAGEDKTWLIRPRARKSMPSVMQSDQDESCRAQITSMSIESNIRLRYARTQVTSRMINKASKTQESNFTITVPETAFISGFVMEIDGVAYDAVVKERDQAWQEYNEAVRSGEGAAHVAASPGSFNELVISVNVEPKATLNFHLDYGELLLRRRGLYEHDIYINPGQVVANLSTVVRITEALPITTLRVPRMQQNQEDVADLSIVEFVRDNEAIVRFSPSEEQQMNFSTNGIRGQFVVQYDVDRSSVDENGGEIYVDDGYFVHFFAPSSLATLAKHVTLLLDTSGSMQGTKIEQIVRAVESLLDQLHPHDFFSVVQFSSTVQTWNLVERYQAPKTLLEDTTDQYNSSAEEGPFGPFDDLLAYPATEGSIARAMTFARSMTASGGTNLNDAVLTALNVSCSVRSRDKNFTSIIILLTDGDPSVGVTDADSITSNIQSANSGGHVTIFSLALGPDSDIPLLKRISSQNGALVRKIDTGSDMAVELRQFFDEISSPVLNDVRFRYEGVDEDTLTETRLGPLFNGSEMVVAGRVQSSLRAVVDGSAVESKTYKPKIGRQVDSEDPELSVQKSWAFLKVKDLLSKAENDSSLISQALNLSLTYNFVTPLTSLVVVKPDPEPPVSGQKASGKVLGAKHKNIRISSASGKSIPVRRPITSYLRPSMPEEPEAFLHEYLEPFQHNASHVILPIDEEHRAFIWNFDFSLTSGHACSTQRIRNLKIHNSGEGACQPINNCIWISPVSPSFDDFCIVDDKYAGLCCIFSEES